MTGASTYLPATPALHHVSPRCDSCVESRESANATITSSAVDAERAKNIKNGSLLSSKSGRSTNTAETTAPKEQ